MSVVLSPGSEVLYYYHFDGLGSVVALSDVNNVIVERYSYDVFGKPSQTSALGNPYMFTGRAYDSEVGLYYYRARYYRPEIGRFLQTDPAGYLAGINWYSYCGNNPIILVDPMGLCGGGAGALLDGVNVASLGLMAAVSWQLGRASLIDPITILIAVTSFALLIRFKVNSTWLIAGGALAGLLRAIF